MLESPATDPGRAAEEMAAYVLIKRGLYWRPNAMGYTGVLAEAGLYTEADARARADGDGTTMQLASEATEFAPACWQETKIAILSQQVAQLQADLIAERNDGIERFAAVVVGKAEQRIRAEAAEANLIAIAKMYGEACGRMVALYGMYQYATDWAYQASDENEHNWQQRCSAEAEAAQLRARLHEAEKRREGSGRDPGGSGHPAEPEPASGLGPSAGCPSRDQAEADPPRRFREVLPEAYGWLVDADGYLWGLTAGDMGYDQTDMRLIDLFDLAVEAEWHRFNITGEKKWPVHTITLDFITTLATALGIEARRAETLGSACESPAPTGAMPDPLTPAPEANQEAGDGR